MGELPLYESTSVDGWVVVGSVAAAAPVSPGPGHNDGLLRGSSTRGSALLRLLRIEHLALRFRNGWARRRRVVASLLPSGQRLRE
jgi:hypothetical protein